MNILIWCMASYFITEWRIYNTLDSDSIVLEKCNFVHEKSLKSPWIWFLKKCGNHEYWLKTDKICNDLTITGLSTIRSAGTDLFKFGVVWCTLSTFHVSSWIMANISESSLLFSQLLFRPCWRKTLPDNYYPFSLDFFKILLFHAAFLIFFSIAIFSP